MGEIQKFEAPETSEVWEPKVGDLVFLNSGGPPMTILASGASLTRCGCRWRGWTVRIGASRIFRLYVFGPTCRFLATAADTHTFWPFPAMTRYDTVTAFHVQRC
jgi:hypothetical protein